MTQSTELENHPNGSPETSIVSAVIPYSRDDSRALYLGYRSSGLSIREALNMIHRSKQWLSLQRLDEGFRDLENRIPEFRKELAKEYIEIEFFRNFRLMLEKDHQVLRKAIRPDRDEDGNILPMSKQDHEYLIKMRSQYSPTQLQILEALAEKSDDGLNFAKFLASNPDIVQLQRTDTVTMAKRFDGES